MRVRELGKMKKKELSRLADQAFEKADEKGPGYLMEAQFYMQELDRRHDSRTSIRDLVLEIVVILLIGGEIWLGWQQGKIDATLMDKQDGILTNLAKSTSATADLVRQQVGLEYEPSINVEYNGSQNLRVYNNGRSPMTLRGVRIGQMAPKLKTNAQTSIPDHNFLSIDFPEYNKEITQTISQSAGKLVTFPIDLYFTNEPGDEFVWNGHITYGRPSGNLEETPGGVLKKEAWSRTVNILSIP